MQQGKPAHDIEPEACIARLGKQTERPDANGGKSGCGCNDERARLGRAGADGQRFKRRNAGSAYGGEEPAEYSAHRGAADRNCRSAHIEGDARSEQIAIDPRQRRDQCDSQWQAEKSANESDRRAAEKLRAEELSAGGADGAGDAHFTEFLEHRGGHARGHDARAGEKRDHGCDHGGEFAGGDLLVEAGAHALGRLAQHGFMQARGVFLAPRLDVDAFGERDGNAGEFTVVLGRSAEGGDVDLDERPLQRAECGALVDADDFHRNRLAEAQNSEVVAGLGFQRFRGERIEHNFPERLDASAALEFDLAKKGVFRRFHSATLRGRLADRYRAFIGKCDRPAQSARRPRDARPRADFLEQRRLKWLRVAMHHTRVGGAHRTQHRGVETRLGCAQTARHRDDEGGGQRDGAQQQRRPTRSAEQAPAREGPKRPHRVSLLEEWWYRTRPRPRRRAARSRADSWRRRRAHG